MRCDEISKTAMEDILICSYAEGLLSKHKRSQMRNTISNKMRELGRLLLQLRETTSVKFLFDILKLELFDNIVASTKVISGYDTETRSYKASSLAMHLGTTLKQVCDVAVKLIIKKSPLIKINDSKKALKDIKRLKDLIRGHWNSEVSSLALKDLNEKYWQKPKLFPLTSDVMEFQKFCIGRADQACENIIKNKNVVEEYRRLAESILALTLLLNRKRIGEVQYLKIKTYHETIESNQEKFLQTLTESEKLLTQNFKRVVTGGKGSRPVAILFPTNLQTYIQVLLSVRKECVPATNEYLFGNPKTENRWLSGYHILKKLAAQSGVKNDSLFTSTRLRKQIASILQVLNISEAEMEQFASFMGHTKETHMKYYRLPQDIYQTAKVSKLLLALNKGNCNKYKGKSLDEIEFSDNAESDSDCDEESEDFEGTQPPREFCKKGVKSLDVTKSKDIEFTNRKVQLPSTSGLAVCSNNQNTSELKDSSRPMFLGI